MNSKRRYKICTCSSHPRGLHVLERSQGRAFEILNRPKAYEKLSEEGRKPYKKIKNWLDQKDPIADIRGKMQGTNIFITLQKLFIVTHVFSRKFQFSMSFTSCAFTWHKQYDSCNRFHFRHIFSSFNYFDLFALYLDK